MIKEGPHCSFCGRSHEEVQQLLGTSKSAICDQCLHLLTHSLEERKGKDAGEGDAKVEKEGDTLQVPLVEPKVLKAHMDLYVVGQELCKKSLSVAIYNHYLRLKSKPLAESKGVELKKSNVLLIGPTGTGKTLMAQTIAKKLSVPFAIADATTLTEAGYVGEDVETVLQRLVQASDYDTERAERGIIFIDEIDKIARKSESRSITRDVSGEGVQQALLKLIEGTLAYVPKQGKRKHPGAECLQVNTENILFICAGAFEGLEKIVSSRLNRKGGNFGFVAGEKKEEKTDAGTPKEVLEETLPEDLVRFGFIPEFIGRLPLICSLSHLGKKELIAILTIPKDALLKQYQLLCSNFSLDLQFAPEALEAIAEKVEQRKTGARGLRAILEKLLMDIMYELPSLPGEKILRVCKEHIEKEMIPLEAIEYSVPGSEKMLKLQDATDEKERPKAAAAVGANLSCLTTYGEPTPYDHDA